MSVFGYVRVSSRGQNEGRQVIAMTEAGVPVERIYIDKQSGKDFERTQYKKMVKQMRPGDVLIVKSIDRFGRDYDEIGTQWRLLTKDMGVDIAILDIPLMDTRASVNGLLGKVISDMMLHLLSYMAQMERENILQRQREGIDAALQSGAKYGRPQKSVPREFESLYEAWARGRVSFTAGAQILGVSRSTFRRWCLKADKDGVCFDKPYK